MTNRRLAVTSRSAACSSPRWTRRARRRSSAGSLISGSFWMSWRYWSNAPDGLARKNAFGFPALERAINGLLGLLEVVDGDGPSGPAAQGLNATAQYRNHWAM